MIVPPLVDLSTAPARHGIETLNSSAISMRKAVFDLAVNIEEISVGLTVEKRPGGFMLRRSFQKPPRRFLVHGAGRTERRLN